MSNIIIKFCIYKGYFINISREILSWNGNWTSVYAIVLIIQATHVRIKQESDSKLCLIPGLDSAMVNKLEFLSWNRLKN